MNYTEQELLAMPMPVEEVKQMLTAGYSVWPSVWNKLLGQLTPDTVKSLVELALEKAVWLPQDVFIYLMQHQAELQSRGLFVFKKGKFDLITVLEQYREQHHDEPWSEAFQLEAVKQPNYKEFLMRLQIYPPEAVQLKLIKRADFVDIINNWPWKRVEFTSCAIAALMSEPIAKIVAYGPKATGLGSRSLAILASRDLSDADYLKVLNSFSEVHVTDETRKQLIALKNHDITVIMLKTTEYVAANGNNVNITLEEQQAILATPNPAELIMLYAHKRENESAFMGRVFDASLQQQVLALLQGDDLTYYVSAVLQTPGAADQGFVDWLAAQPNEFIKGLDWRQNEVPTNVGFWSLTLTTNKTVLFMKMYKSCTKDWEGTGRNPSDKVLIAMVSLPNAPELVAVWEREEGREYYDTLAERNKISLTTRRHYFSDNVVSAMAQLPDPTYRAIYEIASSSLKKRLKEERKN